MLTLILLLWCGINLSAPTWYFVITIVGIVIKFLGYGIKMYDLGSKKKKDAS